MSASVPSRDVTIDANRLLRDLYAIREIGKYKTGLGTGIREKTGLGLITPLIHMGKISDEQVKRPIIVEVAPGSTDRMPTVKSGRGSDRIVLRGQILQMPLAIIQPQDIRLQTIIRHIDIQITILIKIARRHPPAAIPAVAPRQPK